MRTVIRIITLTVLITATWSWGAVKTATTRPGGRELCFELVDGTVVTGRIDVKTIAIRLKGGNVLKIPLADLAELNVTPNAAEPGERQVKIRAGDSVLLGTVAIDKFQIASPYGAVTVKFDRVRRISAPARALRGKFIRLGVTMRDETHIRGVAITKSLRVRTAHGTITVPLRWIHNAAFAADGKTVRVRCWGSDRIVGAVDASATISLKTETGVVKLSVGKMSSLAYGPRGLEGHSIGVFAVAFSRDGKFLASGGGDTIVRVWDTVAGKELFALDGHDDAVSSLVFLPDGKGLISGSYDGTIKIWDLVVGKEVAVLKGHAGKVLSISLSPDGKRLVSGGDDGTVRLWDIAGRKELSVLEGHSQRVTSVAFSPDGKRVASGSSDKIIKLWSAASGKELFAMKGHTDCVFSIVFSPDGKRLATAASDENTVKLWDLVARKELFTFKGHTKGVFAIAISPDGKRLASGSWDTTVKVWDLAARKELLTLDRHSQWVYAVAFSPDGRRLASGGGDKTIRIWDTLNWAARGK